MTTGVSFPAMQWLYWVQSTDECVDSNGNRIQLQHKYFRGEKKIGPYEVDGYMEKDGEMYFYEFQGCYIHPGCCVADKDICGGVGAARKKRKFDAEKAKYLESLGQLYTIRECEWSFTLENLGPIKTQMPRILISDTQTSLLEAIKTGEVFGFAVLDLETPEKLTLRKLKLKAR